jgi:1,4-alpha-glucan branching enzyme
MSSWGYQGYNEFWLNGSNDWLYRHYQVLVDRMVQLANRHPQADGLPRRALNQAAREVLLAQSSDWAFIMKTGTHTGYAYQRVRSHLARFYWLWDSLNAGAIDEPARDEQRRVSPDGDGRFGRPRRGRRMLSPAGGR